MCDHNKGTSHTYNNSYKVVFPTSGSLSIDFYEKALRERELYLNELIFSNRCNGIVNSTPRNQMGFLSSSTHYNSMNSRKFEGNAAKAALPPMKMEILEYFNTVVIPETIAKQKAKASKLETNPSTDFNHLLNEIEELPDEFPQFMHKQDVNDYYGSYEGEMYIEDDSLFKIREKSKTGKNMHFQKELTRSQNKGKHSGQLQCGVYYSKCCATTMSSFNSNVRKSSLSSRVGNRFSSEKGNHKRNASGSNSYSKRNKSNVSGYSGFDEETAWESFIENSICTSSPDLRLANDDDIVIIDDSDSSICSNGTPHIDDRSPDETCELFNDDPALIDFIKNMDDSEFQGIIQPHESKISADNDETSTNKVSSIAKTTVDETDAGMGSIDYTTIDNIANYSHNQEVERIGRGNAVDFKIVNDDIITTTGVADTRNNEQENERVFLTATANHGASIQIETSIDSRGTLNNIDEVDGAIDRKTVESDFLMELDNVETDPEVAIAKPNEDVAIAMDYIIYDDKDCMPKSTHYYPLMYGNKDVIFKNVSVAEINHDEHENKLAIVTNPHEASLTKNHTVNDDAVVGNEEGADKIHCFEVESRIEDSRNVMGIAITNKNLKENINVIEDDDVSSNTEHNKKINVIETIDDNALETYCTPIAAVAIKRDDDFGKIPSSESIGNDSGSQFKGEGHLISKSNISNETTIGEISTIEIIASNASATNSKDLSVSRLAMMSAYKPISVNAGTQWMNVFNAYVNMIRNRNPLIGITTISCIPKDELVTLCIPLYHKLKIRADTKFICSRAVYKVMEYLSPIITRKVHVPNRVQITEVAENTDMAETEIALSHNRPPVCCTNYLKDSIDVIYEDINCKVQKKVYEEDDEDYKENMEGSSVNQNIFEKDECAVNCLQGLISHKTISDVVNGNSIPKENFDDDTVCDYSDLSISNSKATIDQDMVQMELTNSKYTAGNSALDKMNEDTNQEFENNSQNIVEVPSKNVDTSNPLEYSCSNNFNLEEVKESNTYFSSQRRIGVSQSSVTEKTIQSKEIDVTDDISMSQFDDMIKMTENVINQPQESPFEIGVFDIFFSESDCSDEKVPSPEFASMPSAEATSDFLEKLHNMKFDNARLSACQTVNSDTTVALPETEKFDVDKINLTHAIKKQRTITSIQKKEKIDLNDPFSFLSVKVESAPLNHKVIDKNKDFFEGTEALDENSMKVVSECCVTVTDIVRKKQFMPEQIVSIVFSGELLEIAHEMEIFAIPIIQKLLTTNKFGLSLSLTLDSVTSELTHFFLNQELKFCQDNGIDSWQGVDGSCYCQLLLLHGVIKALETLIHVDLSVSVQWLKEYQMSHHTILGDCYQQLLNKICQTHVKLCYENAVHPKIERTSAFLIAVFNQSKACHIEYKVLLIVRRGLQTIFQLLKSSLNEIQSDVDVIQIQESVHLENFSQMIKNKANCIFVANALSLSQNIDCSLLTLIMEYESREDFSFWKNISQSFKIAYSSLQVSNLNFKTLQEIKGLPAFETALHEKIEETQSEVIVFASETLTLNGDLLKLFETKGNITVIGRDYEQWLPDLFFPDISISSDVAILLIMLLDLQDGKFVDNLLNKIFSFHLKYDACWVIFHDKTEKRYSCSSRSKIESSLWHVHVFSNIITSRFEHYKIKFLFVENNDQLLSCVQSIIKKAHYNPEKKKEASLQALFNYDITKAEIFLMSFPCINSFRAQVMLSSAAISKLLTMDIKELTFRFPTFPIHVVELLHSMTHVTVFRQVSPVIENPPTCHSFNSDTLHEFFPFTDDQLTDCSNDIPSSPELDIDFEDPQSLSLEEIDRNYGSLKSEQDVGVHLPYKQQSHFKHCVKESPRKKLHHKMRSNILKSPYNMHSNALELPGKMHSSVEESPYKLYNRVNELPRKLNRKVRESPYKLHYDMRESSYKSYYSSDNYERDSPYRQDGNFCHQLKESSDRNSFYKQNRNSYCHVKESSDRNSAYIAKKPFYKLYDSSNHCAKKESLSDIDTCEITGREKQQTFDPTLNDFSEYSKAQSETEYSTKYGKYSKGSIKGATFTRGAPIENIDDDDSNVVLQKRSFPKQAFEGKQNDERRSILPGNDSINHSLYFQPRYKLYSPDNESDFFLKSENLSSIKDFTEYRASHFQQHPYIKQRLSENPRSRFAASKFKDAELDRRSFGFSKTLKQRPDTSKHQNAIMPETQRHLIASHCFGKNSVDGLKLRDVRPDPSSKIGIVSPMVQVSPDTESPPMDLDGRTISSLCVKSGKKKKRAFNNCESMKAGDTHSPIRKQRKLTYERTLGQKGQAKLIFK